MSKKHDRVFVRFTNQVAEDLDVTLRLRCQPKRGIYLVDFNDYRTLTEAGVAEYLAPSEVHGQGCGFFAPSLVYFEPVEAEDQMGGKMPFDVKGSAEVKFIPAAQ